MEGGTMKKFFKLLYRKWIKGECRNLCTACKYYEYCKGYRELEEQGWRYE